MLRSRRFVRACMNMRLEMTTTKNEEATAWWKKTSHTPPCRDCGNTPETPIHRASSISFKAEHNRVQIHNGIGLCNVRLAFSRSNIRLGLPSRFPCFRARLILFHQVVTSFALLFRAASDADNSRQFGRGARSNPYFFRLRSK